jgi:hypothetical protein
MAQFKPKSRFAAVSGRLKFRMSAADWVRIEAAYGHQLAAPVRRKIRDATRKYLDWVEFEPKAATISETSARVQTIKKAAHKFREIIFQRPPKIGREADYYARSLISKHMSLPFEGRDGLSMGQDAGLIHEILPAGEIVSRIAEQAADILTERLSRLVTQ